MSTLPDDMDAELAELAPKLAEIKALREQKRLAGELPAEKPLSNGADGRFLAGNQLAKGRSNPYAAEVQKRRAALLAAISVQEFQAIIAKLVELALGGNIEAIKEVMLRVLGRPTESDLIEKMDAIEALIEQVVKERESTHPKLRITTH
jgi:hypothetical protein